MKASTVGSLFLILLLLVLGAFFWSESQQERRPVDAEPSSSVGPAIEPEVEDSQARVEPEAVVEEPAGDVGESWSELNRLAILKLQSGDLAGAVADFEQCHLAEPDEPVFASNLAEALARLARSLNEDPARPPEDSIELLARAVELAPDRVDLPALLARWRKSADTEAEFWTDETAHFLMSYDGSRSDVMKYGYLQLESMLETAYEDLGVAFNHYPVGHGDPKIRVVLYKRDEFTEITGVGHWAGGVFDGVVRVPLGDFDRQRSQLERVLRHEVVHAFLRSMGGKQVPAWLNEGLAQWHEESSPLARSANLERARSKLRGQELFALADLQGTLATWSEEEAIARGYAQSLAFVDFIAQWYGEPVLLDMVRGCLDKKDSAEVFRSRIGLELSEVLSDMKSSLE